MASQRDMAAEVTESEALDAVEPEVVSFPSADGRPLSGLLALAQALGPKVEAARLKATAA